MQIAIHGNTGFPERWLQRAGELGHHAVEVNGFSSGIVAELRGFDALLWQLNQDDRRDREFAPAVLSAAELAGLSVYPNHATRWHFDDKAAQKYLLEALGAPLAESWVFYSRKEADQFVRSAAYPLVFKLRCGAGSRNVRLMRDRREGLQLVRRMFGTGLRPYRPLQRVFAAIKGAKPRRMVAVGGAKRFARAAGRLIEQSFRTERERGYVYFQAFIPGNEEDVRVTIIGDKQFCFFRGVREGDFRASGSGRIRYPQPSQIPQDMIETARGVSDALGCQSMAYDFVRDPSDGSPKLLEMSYTFNAQAVAGCPGHFDGRGVWCARRTWPECAILEDLLT